MNIEDVFSYKSLRVAYLRLIQTSTIDVKNYYGEELFSIDLRRNLKELSQRLVVGDYKPSRPFKYFEPKPSKAQRTKTILSIEDSLVYLAITSEIARNTYSELEKTTKFVFGNILHENIKKGVDILDDPSSNFSLFKYYVPLFNEFVNSGFNEVRDKKNNHKLDTDITGFFDSIPHSILLLKLRSLNTPGFLINILGECLNVWSGTRSNVTPYVGIPQGPVASFFYANLVLHDLDVQMMSKGISYYRYTDDIKIYSSTNNELHESLVLIDSYLKSRGLSINSDKTGFYETSILEEKLKLMTVEPLYQIHISDEKIKHLDTEYVDKIETDSSINYNIDDEVAMQLLSEEISMLNKEIKRAFKNIDDLDKEYDEKAVLTYAYKWRKYASFLSANFDKSLASNLEIEMIWVKLLDRYFWRANHFCRNLSFFKLSNETLIEVQNIRDKYHMYEWFRYQSFLAIQGSIDKEVNQIKKLYQYLLIEDSPLVRLALFQLLLSSVDKEDQLYQSIIHNLKNDKNQFIQENLVGYILNSDNKSELLKNWFGS